MVLVITDDQGYGDLAPISLGAECENPTTLCSMDVLGDVAWHQVHVLAALKSTGKWRVNVERPGRYRVAVRRWPETLDLPISAPLDTPAAEELLEQTDGRRHGMESRTITPAAARVRLFDRERRQACDGSEVEVLFELDVRQTGVTELEAWFADGAGAEQGAYYVVVKREQETMPRLPATSERL
jgi:hypothetical protein